MLSINNIIKSTGGKCHNIGNIENDYVFSYLSIDSREIKKNSVYLAFVGENNDGHDFANNAVMAGAKCIIVDRFLENINITQIVVKNTYDALISIAKYNRKHYKGDVIGITGSIGKTSVKEYVASVFKNYKSVFYTKGNFNNHIGIPLMLANLKDEECCVLELGMSNAGEIKFLSSLVKPNVAVVTYIDKMHFKNFNSYEDIAHAKAEIFEYLCGEKLAIINGDADFFDVLVETASKYTSNILLYGQGDDNDFVIKENKTINDTQQAIVCFGGNELKVKIGCVGSHQIFNIMPVLIIAKYYFKFTNIKSVIENIAKLTSYQGRGEILNIEINEKFAKFYDESYNAGPTSMSKSIEYFSKIEGKKLYILGDMLELGDEEIVIHENLYETFKNCNVDGQIYLLGKNMKYLYNKLFNEYNVFYFENIDILIKVMKKNFDFDCVLIKGSNGMKLNKIIKEFGND